MGTAATTIFSAVLVSGLATAVLAADLPRKAPKRAAAVADHCAKVEPLPGTPEVPGGDIFGVTSPTDIGDPCTWALASENSGRAGRRDGMKASAMPVLPSAVTSILQ
jgi:hypothetical protein